MTGPYFALLKPACSLLVYLQLLWRFLQIPSTVENPKYQILSSLHIMPIHMKGCFKAGQSCFSRAAHLSHRFTSMLPQPPFTITVATSVSTHLQVCLHTKGHRMLGAWYHVLANTDGLTKSAYTHLVLLHIKSQLI